MEAENQSQTYTLSEAAIKAIEELECPEASNLDVELDKICVGQGFKLTKLNGSKQYLYYICHLGGKVRELESSEKQREKTSKKCGTLTSL